MACFGPFLTNMRYGLHADMNTLINGGITRSGSLAKTKNALMKRCQKLGRALLPPLIWTKSKRTVVFPRETVPQHRRQKESGKESGKSKSSQFSFFAKGQRLEGQKAHNLKIKVV